MAKAKKDDELLEKEIHEKLKAWAYKEFGQYHPRDNPTGLVQVIKLTMLAQYGEAGWNDHLWLVRAKPKPAAMFLELKRVGGMCTDIQIEKHGILRGMGFDCRVSEGLVNSKLVLGSMIAKALGKERKLRAG